MEIKNLSYNIKSKNIFKNITLTIGDKEKVGIVGENGSGKSTLLNILSGKISEGYTGKIEGNSSAYMLEQEVSNEFYSYTILEYLKYKAGITELENIIDNFKKGDDLGEYFKALEKYESLSGYIFEENIKKILNKIGLNKNIDILVEHLSGGEKIKLLLVDLILKNADIILLDEPTNNLDSKALEYLKEYLISSNKTIVLVSHDEDFLNDITGKIFEISEYKLKEYNMSYYEYKDEKEIEYNIKKAEYENAVDEKNRLEKRKNIAKKWLEIAKNRKEWPDNDKKNRRSKDTRHSGEISKMTRQIESMEIPEFEYDRGIDYFFHFDKEKGNKNIIFENLVCGFEDFKTEPITFKIPFGSKLQIIGGNGTGKTTLVKTILGELPAISGNVIVGADCKIGVISQETILLNSNLTIYEYICEGEDAVNHTELFNILNKFNIDYSNKDKLYNILSPGERTRVNLAEFAYNNTNILILDEPTNHLDLEAIEIIYDIVDKYNGTIISISHNKKYNDKLNPDIIYDIESNKLLKFPI